MNSSRPSDTAAASRSEAIEHLFEVARHGLYLGWFDPAIPAAAGTALIVNPWLKRLLGYPPESPDAAVLLFACEHYLDAAARDRLIEAVLSETGAHDYLVQFRRRDGTLVWAEITAYTTPDGQGPLRIDAIVRDVTQRRRREDHARELYQQLAHSEQLAAIGRTLADVAHELRNPLAAIVGWAERLAQQTLDEKTARGVSEIFSASERAARIVRNMVHSASRQTSTRSMVDLNEIVAETLALRLHDQQATNITCRTEFGDRLPAVFADAHQIQQILLNVIINAEQAMTTAHGRGVITVRTMADERRHMAIVEISDDGPGVPESVRSRIFDPFFTTKQPGAGTGLGLAVTQALALEHGGSVRLANDRSGGTTFVIELPTRDLESVISS